MIINYTDKSVKTHQTMKYLLLSAFCLLSLAIPYAAAAPSSNGVKPFVIPELKYLSPVGRPRTSENSRKFFRRLGGNVRPQA